MRRWFGLALRLASTLALTARVAATIPAARAATR
jgi:hypothetical protein